MSKERFSRTVAILVKAYLNDTLQHNNCTACAIGNLIAGNKNYKYAPTPDSDYHAFCGTIVWAGMPMSESFHWMCKVSISRGEKFHYEQYSEKMALAQIDSTGYSLHEVVRIEKAFENAPALEDWNFEGLMAVVDVLASIDGISLEETEEARKMFVKA